MNWLFRLCLVGLLACCLASPFPAAAGLFGDFTVQDERELGRKFRLLMRSRMPVIEDPVIKGYVEDIVKRILDVMPPQPFEIRADVLLHNSVNAFAAPGGSIFVNTGLILVCEHEAELAGVLAHELAHVSQRHLASQFERSQTANLLTMAGMLASLFLGGKEAQQTAQAGAAGVAQAMMLSYSRQHEDEADQVGMSYLVGAGYPPWGLASAFDKILNSTWRGAGGSIPGYLSTHPDVGERLESMAQRMQRMPEENKGPLPGETNDSRLQRVQTLIQARYMDAQSSLDFFTAKENPVCLDHMGEAVALSRLNRIQDAGTAFTQALDCGDKDPLILREAGRFSFTHGDAKDAGQLLQKAVLLDPDDLMALFFYARLLAENGNTADAARYFERILSHLPEDAEAHYHYGRALGQGGRYFDAHLHLAYSALYGRNMKQYRFHLEKAQALAQKDPKKEKALERLKQAHEEQSEYLQP